jgi:hypothetical protein
MSSCASRTSHYARVLATPHSCDAPNIVDASFINPRTKPLSVHLAISSNHQPAVIACALVPSVVHPLSASYDIISPFNASYSDLVVTSACQLGLVSPRNWDDADTDKEYNDGFDKGDMQEILMDQDAKAEMLDIDRSEVFSAPMSVCMLCSICL